MHSAPHSSKTISNLLSREKYSPAKKKWAKRVVAWRGCVVAWRGGSRVQK